jgi:predicted nuclease with TOPRIM domain
MSDIKNRFEFIRKKITELLEENNLLKLQVSDFSTQVLENDKILQQLIDENNRLKEEKRLMQLSSTVGKDTTGLKKELHNIKREIEESLTLMREK